MKEDHHADCFYFIISGSSEYCSEFVVLMNTLYNFILNQWPLLNNLLAASPPPPSSKSHDLLTISNYNVYFRYKKSVLLEGS